MAFPRDFRPEKRSGQFCGHCGHLSSVLPACSLFAWFQSSSFFIKGKEREIQFFSPGNFLHALKNAAENARRPDQAPPLAF